MRIIGIMTGTSLDGIDIYFGDFEGKKFEKIFYEAIPFDEAIVNRIKNLIDVNVTTTVEEICDLNYDITREYVRAINTALEANDIRPSSIEAISFHGQTVWHNNGVSTLQLGEASILSEHFKVPVVNDFRSADVATGNMGAPLIYLFDRIIFDEGENVVTLNIGGIANISSLIDPNATFDTGPGNMIIDYCASRFFDAKFDNSGGYASKGKLNKELYDLMMSHPYYLQSLPKSTGREDFGVHYAEELVNKFDIDKFDFMYTVTYVTACTIANDINKFVPISESNRLVVSGGGAYNNTLMQILGELLPNYELSIINEYGIDADEKEALAFAYFGYCRLSNIEMKLLNGKKAFLGKVTSVYK